MSILFKLGTLTQERSTGCPTILASSAAVGTYKRKQGVRKQENTLSTKEVRSKKKRYRSRKKKEGNDTRKLELNIYPHLYIYNWLKIKFIDIS